MKVKIRVMTLKDMEKAKELSVQLGYEDELKGFENRFATIQKLSTHHIVVSEIDQNVVGWMHLEIRYSLESDFAVQIAAIVVDEIYRGRGIGKELLKYADRWAHQQGFDKIFLHSNIKRTDTHKFYENYGYKNPKQSKVFLKDVIP